MSDAAAPAPQAYGPPQGPPVPGPPPPGTTPPPVSPFAPPQDVPAYSTPGYQPVPYGSPPPPAPAPPGPPRSGLRSELLAGVLVGLGLVLLGAPLGLLWSAVAPRPDVVFAAGSLNFADQETKDFIAADGLLFLLLVAVGVLAGALAWRYARRTPFGVLVGLTLGGALAALVAAKTGVLVDDRAAATRAIADGTLRELPLKLQATAALLGCPAGAVLTFALQALRRPQELPA